MKKALVIINEQHKMLPEQSNILSKKFKHISYYYVPEKGWTTQEMDIVHIKIQEKKGISVVFVSAIAYLIKQCLISSIVTGSPDSVLIFQNDNREKKEFPGGIIKYVVPQTGWKLV